MRTLQLGARAFVLATALFAAEAAYPQYSPPQYLFRFGQSPVITGGMFNFDTAIDVNSVTGDVYVADTTNRIQRFGAAGNFLGSWTCEGCLLGVGVDDATGHVYATQTTLNRVRTFTASGSFVRDIGTPGSGNGQLLVPTGVAVDSATGNVYVRDAGNGRVQVFDSDGNFLFKFGSPGTGPGQFEAANSPQSIDFDPGTRRVYVNDPNYTRLQVFDEFGTFLMIIGGARGPGPGELRWPRDLEAGPDGNVYVADTDNERIHVFNASNGSFVQTFQGLHDFTNGPFHPRGIAINRNTGKKYAAAAYSHRVDVFDAANQYQSSFGYWFDDGLFLRNARTLYASPATGDLFVLDSLNFLFKRFTAGGKFLNQWGQWFRLNPDQPGLLSFGDHTFTIDPDGDVWLAKNFAHYVGQQTPFLQQMDETGNVLGHWLRGNVNASYEEHFTGIAVEPFTRLVYVSDWMNNRVVAYRTSPALAEVDSVNLASPSGLLIHDGFLYVLTLSALQVRKFTLDLTPVKAWGGLGSGPGQLNLGIQSGITADAEGRLYVSDRNNHRIVVFDTDGGYVGDFNGTGLPGRLSSPSHVSFSPINNLLYVADSGWSRVVAFSVVPSCADGRDNDGNGAIDTADPGCTSVADQTEQPDCGDGIDNEGDGLFDGDDPACPWPTLSSERPQCDDGIDNDGDGGSDWDGSPPDSRCTAAWVESEAERACGLGAEVALALAPLLGLRRRRRPRGESAHCSRTS